MYQRTGTYACTYGTHDFESVLCFSAKIIITGSQSRKSVQKKTTGRKSPRNATVTVFSPLPYVLSTAPPVRLLQGLPQANFNPKTYRIFIFHERRAFYALYVSKTKEGTVLVPERRRPRRIQCPLPQMRTRMQAALQSNCGGVQTILIQTIRGGDESCLKHSMEF